MAYAKKHAIIWAIILVIILPLFGAINVNAALCWNPLELFCIFQTETATAVQETPKATASPVFSVENPNDLTFNRTADKINLTWNGRQSYATIQIRFYYGGDGKTYSVSQAQSFGATFDDWVVSNTGKSIKWGGMANVSGVSSTIRNNGFYPVFEMISTSPNLTVRKDEGKLWLGEEVWIDWKDDNNPLNKFNVFNKTTVYLTNNGSLFHDTIVYDPTVFTTTTILSNYPNQRKMFWDGSNWFVFYRSGTTIVYNFSSDLVNWNKGLNVITLPGAAANSRPDIVYRNISGWKTFFLYASMNNGLSQYNYSRGTINANNGLNITNNITVASRATEEHSFHVGMSTTNYYFMTTHATNTFAVGISNRSLNADTGDAWAAPETGFNISGANMGANSPASKFAELDNGNMMQVAKELGQGSIHARNFTEQPTWSWSAATEFASDTSTGTDNTNDWDAISLNVSGKLNTFVAYVNNTGTIRLWQSDGARTKWNPVANMSTQAFAYGNGTVLSKNDTHIFVVYFGNEPGNKTVYYRTYEPVSRAVSNAFFISNSTATKKGLTVAERSNGTDIAVGWTEVSGSTHTLVVNNLTHASMAAAAEVSDDNATLNVTLYTGSWLNATVNTTITVNASVLASGGNGHQVNGTIFFGQGNPVSQRINATQFGFPFYNTSQNFTCGFMQTNDRCDLNITINLTTIGAYWNLTFNFTSNNTFVLPNGSTIFRLNISDVVSAPANTAPSCNWINPTSNARIYSNNASLQASCTDPEGDTLTYRWGINGTLNQTTIGNTTINFTAGNYAANVSAYDGALYSPNQSITFNLNGNITLQVTTLGNWTPHSENISATFHDPDGAADIINHSISTTSGNCQQLTNTSSGNLKNFTFNCTGTGLTSHTVTITANSTWGNWTKAEITNTYPNIAPPSPTWRYPANNQILNTRNFSTNISSGSDSDGDVLTYYWHRNGSFVQSTTFNSTMNVSSDGNYALNVSISDGAQYSSNATISIDVDGSAPAFYNNGSNVTSTTTQTTVQLSINWSDNFWINTTILEDNFTGTVTNTTVSAGGARLFNVSFNRTITLKGRNDSYFRFYGNDTAGNYNSTIKQVITIANSIPICSWDYPSGGILHFSGNISLNGTCSDLDFDTLTYYWYVNGSFNKTTNANTSINFTKGNYVANLSAYDGFGFAANMTVTFDLTNNITIHATTLTNLTQHSFNFSTAFIDPDGASDVINYSVSTTSGTCNQFQNTTSGQLFNLTVNCTGSPLVSATVTVTVNDTRGNVSKSIITNTYPNSNPTATWIHPTNNMLHYSGNVSLQFSKSDADNGADSYTWYVYVNGTFNKTTTTNSSINFTKGNYVFNLSVNDGTVFSPNVTVSVDLTNNITVHHQAQFTNYTNQHSANVSAAFLDPDGASDIINYSCSVTAGNCNQLVNTSSGNLRNFTFNVTGTGLAAYTITITVNDTRGNVSKVLASSTYPNTAPSTPTIFQPANNGYTNRTNHSLTYSSGADADGDAITYYIFWQQQLNQSISGNTTMNLSDAVTNLLNVSAYDGAQFSANATVNYTVDATVPTFANNGTNASSVTTRQYVRLTANFTDNFGLSFIILEDNFTGTPTNTTQAATSNPYNATFNNQQITVKKGNDTYYKFYVNDTAGNFNSTARQIITVTNSPPNAIINIPTEGQTFTTSNVSFNVSGTDLDNDSLTWYWALNGTFNKTTTNGNTTFNLSNADYQLNVTVNDGTAFSQNQTRKFTINTAAPPPPTGGGSGSGGQTTPILEFINLNLEGTSYIHITDFNPQPTQPVGFTVFLKDATSFENVTFYYSTDNRQTWQNKQMIYDSNSHSFNTQIGGYPAQTKVYYYVTAANSGITARTPLTLYDSFVWDNPPGVPSSAQTINISFAPLTDFFQGLLTLLGIKDRTVLSITDGEKQILQLQEDKSASNLFAPSSGKIGVSKGQVLLLIVSIIIILALINLLGIMPAVIAVVRWMLTPIPLAVLFLILALWLFTQNRAEILSALPFLVGTVNIPQSGGWVKTNSASATKPTPSTFFNPQRKNIKKKVRWR